jgi:hypothetical protein
VGVGAARDHDTSGGQSDRGCEGGDRENFHRVGLDRQQSH